MHEHTVQIATPDGVMPVEMFHPSHEDTYPGIVFYMDVFGLRDELRDMCRRFAVAGYAVALPSMYYRAGGPSFPPSNGPHDAVPEEARRLNLATTQAMSASDTRALLDSPHPIGTFESTRISSDSGTNPCSRNSASTPFI